LETVRAEKQRRPNVGVSMDGNTRIARTVVKNGS
jgi:hypothetical protein